MLYGNRRLQKKMPLLASDIAWQVMPVTLPVSDPNAEQKLLAAQALRPDSFVAMAAYGDYGPGYIGTEVAYTQGGYETEIASRTAPSVEKVLMDALRQVMGVTVEQNK